MAMRGGVIRRGEVKPQKRDWRDHPLAIAAIVAAASISLTASVGLPLVTGHLNDQVESLRTRTADQADKILTHENTIGALQADVRRKDAALAEAQERLKAIHKTLSEARLATPFNPGSPYPRGFESLQLGMSQVAFVAEWGDRKIKKNEDDYWSMELDHPLFSSVTVYFYSDKPSRPVYQLFYHFKYKHEENRVDDSAVRTFLVSALGRPLITVKDADLWKTPKGELASFESGTGLIIAEKDVIPRWVLKAAAAAAAAEKQRQTQPTK